MPTRLGLVLMTCICSQFSALAAFANTDDTNTCPTAHPPVLSLDYGSRYNTDDSSRSNINSASNADVNQQLEPLDDFLIDLSEQIVGIYEDDQDPVQVANCVVSQLAEWAKADALSDLGSETAELTIGSRLASIGLIMLQASWHSNSYGDILLVDSWVEGLMDRQMTFWETAPEGASRGNLRAWAALAATAHAYRTEDIVLQSWAIWSTNYVMCTANEDGSLPQEMRRGRYALHYQLHAISPLVTSVALLKSQGHSLDWRCNFAINRIVNFALSDLDDGQQTQAITGQQQSFFDGSALLAPYQLAWLEAYVWLNPSTELEELLESVRPLTFSKLGGHQTLFWTNIR